MCVVIREAEACSRTVVFVIRNDSILQTAGLTDDGKGSIAEDS